MQSEFFKKRIVVVGAGRTGCALTRFFLERRAQVVLSDARPAGRIAVPGDLAQGSVRLDLGGHSKTCFDEADLVVVSPGVPSNLGILNAARERGIPVLGEIEIAARALTAPLAAITGTNGKSTVTTLMGEMFKACGQRTFVGGNLGTPLIEAVGGNWDWLVAELSSFQLETIALFRPKFGVLLNISEDHLDRYPDMASYQAAKARLFENMTGEDVAVLNREDQRVLEVAKDISAVKVFFSSSRSLEQGMCLEEDELVWRGPGGERRFPVRELCVQGLHNLENVMAALIPPLWSGCPADAAWKAALAFRGLPHRMALVGEFGGLRWFNDSKGTNIGIVVKSLEGCRPPLTLIAGGKDKQGSLAALVEPVRRKVDHVILIGEAAERMEQALTGQTRIHRAASLEEAVRTAAAITPAGGTVLLSPGCSSFDMFTSYEERGRSFEAAVRQLAASI